MNTQSVIDETIFEALKENMGEILPILIEAFLEDGTVLLQEIFDGVNAQNKEAIATAAHTMKSSAKNIGAVQLSVYCAEIENVIEEEDGISNIEGLLGLHTIAKMEMGDVTTHLNQVSASL